MPVNPRDKDEDWMEDKVWQTTAVKKVQLLLILRIYIYMYILFNAKVVYVNKIHNKSSEI